MQDPDLTRYIVARLSGAANRSDLILELCESRGLTWPEAEAIVQRVEADQQHQIAGRQFPLLFFIALLVFLGGLALVIYDSYVFITILSTDIRTAFNSLDIVTHLRLIFDIGVAPLTGITVGAAMMLGSLAGMRRAWVPLIEYFSERISHARR
jgi:hypothetical protein